MTKTLWMSADSRPAAPGLGTRGTGAIQANARDLPAEQSRNEGDVGVLVTSPPLPELPSEDVQGLSPGFLIVVVQPQQPSQRRDVIRTLLN